MHAAAAPLLQSLVSNLQPSQEKSDIPDCKIRTDPAAETFLYPTSIDIRELVTLGDVMEELELGPNGCARPEKPFQQRAFPASARAAPPAKPHQSIQGLSVHACLLRLVASQENTRCLTTVSSSFFNRKLSSPED